MEARKGRPSLVTEYKEVDFNRPHNPDNVSKEFRRTVKEAGIMEFSLHDLRHTHATLLLIDRVPVHAVAHRLGHSTSVITMQTYAHVLQRAEDQAVAISGDILRAAMGTDRPAS
jgi:integrase